MQTSQVLLIVEARREYSNNEIFVHFRFGAATGENTMFLSITTKYATVHVHKNHENIGNDRFRADAG